MTWITKLMKKIREKRGNSKKVPSFSLDYSVLERNVAEMMGKSYLISGALSLDNIIYKDVYKVDKRSNSIPRLNLNLLIAERINPHGLNDRVSGEVYDSSFINGLKEERSGFRDVVYGLLDNIESRIKEVEKEKLADGFIGNKHIGFKTKYLYGFEKYVDNLREAFDNAVSKLEPILKDPITKKKIIISDETKEYHFSNVLRESISEEQLSRYKKEHDKYIDTLIEDAFFNLEGKTRKHAIDSLRKVVYEGNHSQWKLEFNNNLTNKIGDEKFNSIDLRSAYTNMESIIKEYKKREKIISSFEEVTFDDVLKEFDYKLKRMPRIKDDFIIDDSYNEVKGMSKNRAYEYLFYKMKESSERFFKIELGVDKLPERYKLEEKGMFTGDDIYGLMATTYRKTKGNNIVERFKNKESKEAFYEFDRYLHIYQNLKQVLE